MRNDIYIPAGVAEAIVQRGRENRNPATTTRIMIGDYRISIAMDTSITGFHHNLDRTDIRIYDVSHSPDGVDVTNRFGIEMGGERNGLGNYTFTTSDDLFDIMAHARDLMARKRLKFNIPSCNCGTVIGAHRLNEICERCGTKPSLTNALVKP